MAAPKKGAAPKAAPKAPPPKAPVAEAPAAPADAAAAVAPAAPAEVTVVDLGGAAPGAGQALAAEEADAQAGQDEPQGLADGTVVVSCAKGLERFHRAGMRFTREPTVLALDELEPGVLERLQAEPRLVVRLAQVPQTD